MSERALRVNLVAHPLGRYGTVRPAIFIDGVAQPFQWGTGTWRVPADHPVVVAVMIFDEFGTRRGFAEYAVQPGESADLEYRAPAFFTARGALGPMGTVHHQGVRQHAMVMAAGAGFIVLALAVTLAIVVPIALS